MKAVVLLSGGLDSTTCLAIARTEGFETYAFSVNYNQRHASELLAATRVAEQLGAKDHRIVSVTLDILGGSALTDSRLAVPTSVDPAEIPITYVPARNLIFLSLAAAYAETLGAVDIFIGANVVDYSNYPDCREPFLRAFEQVATLGTQLGTKGQAFRIHAPLLQWSKAEIIQRGLALGVNYAETVSCYQATDTGLACGQCPSCDIRRKGFVSAGLTDPTRYLSFH